MEASRVVRRRQEDTKGHGICRGNFGRNQQRSHMEASPSVKRRSEDTKDHGIRTGNLGRNQQRSHEAIRSVRRCPEDTKDHSIFTGNFGKIPPELFPNILKFLSAEDLSLCASVCKFLRLATSDESLWCRLYCLRWGHPSQEDGKVKPRGSAWKKLYFERDNADMADFVKYTPAEFREYYIQMQAAKRSQAPGPAQVRDDLVVVDMTVADHIMAWRRSNNLPDVYEGDHWCSGQTCAYNQIGDIFLCEKTGRAHVCDDTCRETVLDPSNELLVCTVSGRCFDRFDGEDEDESTASHQQAESISAAEGSESYMIGRAYILGYNCVDEKELAAAQRQVVYPGFREK